MPLPKLLKFLWRGQRKTILAYTMSSLVLVVVFAYAGYKETPDFNALSLLRFLNLCFTVSSVVIARQCIYRNYQDGSRYFYNALPIEPVVMRFYEQTAYFLLAAVPYLLTIPCLLLLVNYNGLWSTRQVIEFLTFQLFFVWVVANIAVCLAMSGRLCWYVFIIIVVCCNLYYLDTKDESAAFLGFLDVDRVLFKTGLLTLDTFVRYGLLALMCYALSIALGFSIGRGQFVWLHQKENGLSYGLLAVFASVMLTANFYYSVKLNAGHIKFSGLYLTRLSQSPDIYWSSSVQLSAAERRVHGENITRLSRDIAEFANRYAIGFPSVHYRHHPERKVLKAALQEGHFNNDLEVEFDFNQLDTQFADLESDILAENFLFLSNGWLGKEDKLILLRGLASHWSWRNGDKTRLQNRFVAFSSYFQTYSEKEGEWLKVYQDSGPCLFDAFAANVVSDAVNDMSKEEFSHALNTGLNLDNSWVPFHLIRSVFSNATIPVEQTKFYQALHVPLKAANVDSGPTLAVKPKETFPGIYKIQYEVGNIGKETENAALDFYEHDKPGKKVDRQTVARLPLTPEKSNTVAGTQLMLKNDRFSATLSWFRQDLACRINLPWRYVEL